MPGRRLLGLIVLIVALIASFSRNTQRPASRGHAFAGETIHGKVVSVSDGDTLTVLDDAHRQHRIRLFGIDAPELGQAFGRQSKENLARMVFGKTVDVEVVDVDQYGREVGRVYLDGHSINLAQVADGMAWRYVAFDRDHEFDAAEASARREHRGLWADPHPVPPWDYRREHRRRGQNRGRSPERQNGRDRFDERQNGRDQGPERQNGREQRDDQWDLF